MVCVNIFIMRLAIFVAGVVYSCRNPWAQLSCIAHKTGAHLFTSLETNAISKTYTDYLTPTKSILLNKSSLHSGIRKHIPWIHERPGNMVFLKDEQCCHAPYLLFRRFLLTEETHNFTHVLMLRPDSVSNFDCDTTANMLKQEVQGIVYEPSFSNEHSGHACPQSINDQWFWGDAHSVRLLLGSFPRLKTWHKTWEADPNFDRWWLKGNRVQVGRFFLNTEGIYGKMLQSLNLTCKESQSLRFNRKKEC